MPLSTVHAFRPVRLLPCHHTRCPWQEGACRPLSGADSQSGSVDWPAKEEHPLLQEKLEGWQSFVTESNV